MVAAGLGHGSQVEQCPGNAPPTTKLPPDRQALPEPRTSGLIVALIKVRNPEVDERAGNATPVTQLPSDRQGLFVQPPGSRVVALLPDHDTGPGKRLCADRCRRVRSDRKSTRLNS